MLSTWARWIGLVVVVCALVGCSGAQPAGGAAVSPAGGARASAGGAGAAPSNEPVVLAASQNVTNNIFVWLTHEHDLFARNGVNVDMQNINAITAIKALVAGQLNGVILGSPEVIAARAAGSDLTIVAVFNQVYNQMFVPPPPVTAPDQLRGKTIGVITRTSINGVGTERALRTFGLEAYRDYNLVETGAAGTYQALFAQMLTRNVDAAGLEPGYARKAVEEGYRVLFDQATMDLPTASGTLTFHTDYVRQHPVLVQKVVDSLIEGVRFAKQNRAETQAAYSKYFKITDPTELELTYDRVVGQILARAPYPALEQFPDTIEAMAKEQPEVRSVDVATLIDRRFVDDAVRRGLTNY